MTPKATHPPIHAHRLTFQPRHREIIKMIDTLLRSLAAQFIIFLLQATVDHYIVFAALCYPPGNVMVFQTVGFIQDVIGD